MKEQNNTIFDLKIKTLFSDYKFKKNKALRSYHLSEAIADPVAKSSLQDKAEKWIAKAEMILQKIEETKLSKKLVLQKKAELNNNQLETNQGQNIL